MDVNTRTQTEEKRIIEINDIEFYVEDLVQPLGWLKRGEVEDELVNSAVLRRMKKAGLVRKKRSGGFMSMSDDDPVTKWEQIDGKCSKLFDKLNEPYCRLRPKIVTKSGFGMWDEKEDENAREKAEKRLEELRERNPDVEWELDEEELSSIPIR